MSTLSITLPSHTFITNGKHITFRAPCSSKGITGVVINGDNQEYKLRDSRKQVLPSDIAVFNEGVMVHVILDVDNHIAYIQNVGSTTGSQGVSGVADFNGRTGSVEPQAGDYTAAMVGASPATHANQHASGGADPITPASIGAATAGHDHNGTYSPIGHNHNTAYATIQHTHQLSDIDGLGEGGSGDLQAISDLQEDVKNLQEAMGSHTHTLIQLGAASADHDHNSIYSPLKHDHDGTYTKPGHTHGTGDITGLSKVATSGAYSDLSGTPSSFNPSAHASTHAAGGADAITPASIGALDQATANTYYAGVNHSHTEYITPSEVDTKIAAAIAAIPVYRGE